MVLLFWVDTRAFLVFGRSGNALVVFYIAFNSFPDDGGFCITIFLKLFIKFGGKFLFDSNCNL